MRLRVKQPINEQVASAETGMVIGSLNANKIYSYFSAMIWDKS